MKKWIQSGFVAVMMLFCAACAPRLMAYGDPVITPRDAQEALVMSDGAHLPLRSWKAQAPKAVLLGVHGFNDYSNAFAMPGEWFAGQGVTVYAYDQRGFGRAPGYGYWAGTERMSDDLRTVVNLLQARHPGLPFFIVGESMGGALLMHSMASPDAPHVQGIILAAPAVWGWRSLNMLYSSVLWTSARLAPGLRLSGQGLGRQASDNIEMLRGLGRDPLVIKKTRIATIYGLVDLMDQGAAAAPSIDVPVLFMYGARDEIVPAEPVSTALRQMRSRGRVTPACYPNGWHMLLRDNEREIVWRDMAAWMTDQTVALPSAFSDLAPCGPLAKSKNSR